jgi:carbon storage regulator
MLVLSRKCGEALVIGNHVTVRVVEVKGDRVKLAFDAPTRIPIHRAEIQARIQGELDNQLESATAAESC